MSDPDVASPTPAVAAQSVPDGRGLGIAALVFAFVFQVVGLILGFVALDQSKRAGRGNAPARAAIIVSIVLIVLWIGAGIAALTVASTVAEDCDALGPGIHEVDGVQIVCPG